jgi:hypothetical protein
MARIETIRTNNGVVINVPGQPSVDVRTSALTADIRNRLMIHGLAQKLADSMAKERDPVTGKSATFAVKYASLKRIADALVSGEWTVKAERLAPDAITPDRVAAVCAARNVDRPRVESWLAGLTPDARAKVFAAPAVMVELARIRASRATVDDDADPFAGLGDEPEDDEQTDDDEIHGDEA